MALAGQAPPRDRGGLDPSSGRGRGSHNFWRSAQYRVRILILRPRDNAWWPTAYDVDLLEGRLPKFIPHRLRNDLYRLRWWCVQLAECGIGIEVGQLNEI